MSVTYEELLQEMLNQVTSDVDKREGSIIYDALAPCAYFLAQQNFQLDHVPDLVFADTAADGYLDRIVSAFGMTRKAASAAIRKIETSGSIPVGTRWAIDGLVYIVTAKITATSYEAECELTGDIGNQYSGALQPISNVYDAGAELTDILVAGSDRETDEALRNRFYQKVRYPATSGNAYHYKLWALEVPGVGDAKVFPLAAGPGTLTVQIVNSDKMIDPTLVSAVAAYIEDQRPIGALVTVESPVAQMININAEVLLDGTMTLESVADEFRNALEEYRKELVFNDYRVSYAKAGSLLLATAGVKDYNNLMLNEAAANIVITEHSVPVIGTLNLMEVTARGLN